MNLLAFIENINGPELILIFLVVLLLFGAERLPGLFKSLGQSVREFKKATRGIEEDIRSAMDVESTPVTPRAAPQTVAQQNAATIPPTETAVAASEADKADYTVARK
ncbi:MAG: twin-arginine translocase TatA/TatE family subunit [Puniceicoccaceae bacterium]|nr:twin-arginine translocase TatA/TatE family subunit [Puniceicoccaceae bacterium]|tara:strand:+ start:868 stop:1188 length:321 start_codon:yes stop_codon:yes gene_type:complete